MSDGAPFPRDVPIPTGRAKLAGVIGWPVAHSRSPRLHGYWLREYRIDGAYVPLAVRPADFDRAIRALPLLGFRGANVTVPHKEAAVLAMDRLTVFARRVGAVNTIVVESDGCLTGDNTDSFGFIENLRASHHGWSGNLGPAVILGAGGSARAVCVALMDEGVPEIRIINRTADRAEKLAADIGGRFRLYRWAERGAALEGATLLVNTTSLGLTGQPPLDLDLTSLPIDAVVADLVYEPLETALLLAARTRGNPAIDGFGMLLHQARPGFAAWFGIDPAVTPALCAFVLADP